MTHKLLMLHMIALAPSPCQVEDSKDRGCRAAAASCSKQYDFEQKLPRLLQLRLTIESLKVQGLRCLCVTHSKRYDFNPELPEERRRQVMTIAPVDWAAEWLRPITPNFKHVGSVLAGPGKPLPANLEVSHPRCSVAASCMQGQRREGTCWHVVSAVVALELHLSWYI